MLCLRKTKFIMIVKDKDFKKFYDLVLTRKGTILIQYQYEYYDYDNHYIYTLFVRDYQYREFHNKLEKAKKLGIVSNLVEETP